MAQPTTRLRPIETVTPVWSAPTHVSLLVQPPAPPSPAALPAVLEARPRCTADDALALFAKHWDSAPATVAAAAHDDQNWLLTLASKKLVLKIAPRAPRAADGPRGRRRRAKIDGALAKLPPRADGGDAETRDLAWDLGNASRLGRPYLPELTDATLRKRVEAALDAFDALTASPAFETLPRQLIHGDINDENVHCEFDAVRDRAWAVAVLDFGDFARTCRVFELAILLAYALFDGGGDAVDGEAAVLDRAARLVGAYHAATPLAEAEVAALPVLVATRNAQTVLNSAHAYAANPDPYVLVSAQPATRLLGQFAKLGDGYACDGDGGAQLPRRATFATLLLAPVLGFVAKAPLASAPERQSSRTVVSAALVGITKPMGYFDPLQLSKGKSEADMNQLREYELKHGRVAMAAVFGIIVEPRFHPLADSCHVAHPTDPILAGVELNFAGKAQILGFCAGVEALTYYIKKGDNYKPGDLLGAAYYVADEEDELWINYQEKELNNGRLAMMAFAGFVTQYLLRQHGRRLSTGGRPRPCAALICTWDRRRAAPTPPPS
ncbi:chlorophyll A-B binding protein [Aureococcus anophagefferens]|nr:chlorophyll A-B binding protein [Aureococcus anophagefferens]